MNDPISFSSRFHTHISKSAKQPVEKSYTAQLLKKGKQSVLKKIAEESSEVLMAAMDSDTPQTIRELADLYYHLHVLMLEMNIHPSDVKKELTARMNISGLEEKALRNTPPKHR